MATCNYEIVPSDADIAEMFIQADERELFVTQVDTGGLTSSLVLNVEMAKQVMAVLASFVEGRIEHTSDCALFNSPAYPIEPCSCALTARK